MDEMDGMDAMDLMDGVKNITHSPTPVLAAPMRALVRRVPFGTPLLKPISHFQGTSRCAPVAGFLFR